MAASGASMLEEYACQEAFDADPEKF